jgi:Icc-related predicted phosphoesterase
MEIDGWHIAGLGYSSPTPFNTPGEYSEAEIARRLQPFSGLKPLVLICHCPPLNTTLDRIRPGLHAGSSAIREFIEREQPELFFCGHIHEAEGVAEQIGSTRAVNVGKLGFLLELPPVT